MIRDESATWSGSEQARRLVKSKSFAEANERRADLIDKDITGGGLTRAEHQEYEALQAMVGGLVNAAYPRSVDGLEGVESLVDRLMGRRDRHAGPTPEMAMDGLG